MVALLEQAKSDLEIRMYKNISDAIRERLMFFATEKQFKGKKNKEKYERIMRLLKIEILNHIEYACIMYLDGRVNKHTFEEFYLDIIKNWAKVTKENKTDKTNKSVYSSITSVNKKWKKEGRYAIGI
jgi:hypothetical protein